MQTRCLYKLPYNHYHPLDGLLDQQIPLGFFFGALVQLVRILACHARGHGFESHTHRMKEKQLKVKVELTSLESVLAKLEEKYTQFPSKNLSDTITHLQATIRSLKNV